MPSLTRTVVFLLALASAGCFMDSPSVERRLERSFQVAPGSVVSVQVSGGSVTSATGPAGVVRLTLEEQAPARSEREADDMLAEYDVAAVQNGDEVKLTAKRKPGFANEFTWRWIRGVRFSVRLEAPADVRLDLHTSGGAITVNGARTASLRAHTSGGSVRADGGSGEMTLNTSGGAIDVGRALGALSADTSGGGIRVAYVGPAAERVDLSTSGGGIHADVDAAAKLEVSASTSGGGVKVEGLAFDSREQGRSHVRGTLNGGGNGILRASTSGGSITIRRAGD